MEKQPQLSARRRQILDIVKKSIEKNGYAPSIREIADAAGLASPSTVKHHLDALTNSGYIRSIPGRPRTLEILFPEAAKSGDRKRRYHVSASAASHLSPSTDKQKKPSANKNEEILGTPITALELPVSPSADESTAIPLVGQIAAGEPITAEQYIEDVFTVPTRLTGHGNLFMVQVRGESMIEAGILDGDYVVIRSQASASDSEIVAAMIDGEATVKVLSHADGHVWLMPCNSDYSPIPGDQAVILGKVVTVLRSL